MSVQSSVRGPFLLKRGDQLLKQRCLAKITKFPVEDEVLDTIDLCKDALRTVTGFWSGKAMSVASTQVGKPQVPLFVMCARDKWYTAHQYRSFQTFINPRILAYSEHQCLAWEGCISNDDDMCLMERPIQVKAAFQDLKGKQYELLISGLMSRIFQHEIDHLQGLLMWDDSIPEELLRDLPEDCKVPPRRIDKTQSLCEIESEEAMEDFYQKNKRFIFEE